MNDTIKSKEYSFTVALKTFPQHGNLVYEYNPFHNYRLNETMIYYKNRLWKQREFCDEIGLKDLLDLNKVEDWENLIPKSETFPVVYQKGQLVDFETDELDFSLNNPVDIIPQWSYDNSTNLIINDGKNPPRLINSRFSVTEKNQYQVCNRKGNNDTNIYDQGPQFNIDTSLYKKMTTIPRLRFLGLSYGGQLGIGNYHFYFKYVDEDGNESEFFAESGLVSVFIGNTADSIHSGFRDENSHKQAKFLISNTDPSYSKIVVYYTKATSDIFQNATIKACRIQREFEINEGQSTYLVISGFDGEKEVTISDINAFYQVYGSAETQATAQNMLFLANVDKPKTEYEDLSDCALRFLPVLNTDLSYNTDQIGLGYTGSISNTYYDSSYIYNSVGYWDDEMYRFGVVFIKSDNTLTEVFNVRGIDKLNKIIDFSTYSKHDFFDENGVRKYINYTNESYKIIKETELTTQETIQENAKGVIRIDCSDFKTVIGINFKVPEEVLEYLKTNLKIKGFFFVRQKRIPTTLCQAYTIGIDKQSHTPVLPVNRDNKDTYITEGFLAKGNSDGASSIQDRYLTHDFESRVLTLENHQVKVQGALCPDYDVNSPYLNSLFSASEMVCRNCQDSHWLKEEESAYFAVTDTFDKKPNYSNIKVIGVEDNTKLVSINSNLFSARAGEAEEAFRFEYAGVKNVNTEAQNLLRGSYGPYLGITGYENPGHLIDIKIPGYNPGYIDDYFTIRYNDKSAFYAISDRFDLNNTDWWLIDSNDSNDSGDSGFKELLKPIYRGDCYICQFTHRFNRNFQDPSSPTNDEIIDETCWVDNFEVTDGVVKTENFEKINLGDVNAIKMGMYITLTVRSTMNLNIRSLDGSQVDEAGLFGHERGFFPFHPMNNSGSYKIPEALCYNKGFEKSLSERVHFEVADVPWIKNEFSNRIAYSNIQVQDAFQNGWRTFWGSHYRDYPKTYGSITKLLEFRGNLICVFEHGVALIPVNERALAASGAGGDAYITTSNVLPENPKIISDTFGSQWKESVIKTSFGVYGVDTVGKKIWRTNGEMFECISDFRIQEFLNNNISLSERELNPIIGIRNVKTHYNKFKHDVMFTFYDNLYGFEEKVWNVCYSEVCKKWITFYSWVPSYSENIYNQFFSFDRNTSKWIAKLGVSNAGNDFSDGVTLDKNIIPNNAEKGYVIGKLFLSNRTLPTGDGVTVTITYTLERDNFGNYNNFSIEDGNLVLKTSATDLCSEFYQRGTKTFDNNKYTYTAKIIEDESGKINDNTKQDWINNCILNSNYSIIKDDLGRRKMLNEGINTSKIVYLLNIRANITVTYSGAIPEIAEAYLQGYTNGTSVDAGYYQSVVAVIPEYNKQFLTTDFWKHGQAGIIDIADDIYPTYWYGKQHPFEFEFVVADTPQAHKIFDNLEIISNNAEPESFHYEITGDCYDFAKDKKNMYIRQEATKELYQYNGSDVIFNSDYIYLDSEHRKNFYIENGKKIDLQSYDKSTLLPLYYQRVNTINEIEDSYKGMTSTSKDYDALSGGEIVRYKNLNEYHIQNHAKAVDITDPTKGRLRGNMQYKEDRWQVQINPLNIVQKNESEWKDLNGNITSAIPVELNQNPLPSDVLGPNSFDVPKDFNRGYTSWNWEESEMKEAKLKDKWIKIKVRYKGNKLAIISAINTLYSISYS